MKIYVASFFEPKNHRGRPLSIAIGQPKNFKDIKIVTCLLPSWGLVSKYRIGQITKEDYERIYEQDVLNHLTPYMLRSQIIKAVGKTLKEVTLLCWEKEGEFCHRTLVYNWLKKWKKEKPNIWSVIELGELHRCSTIKDKFLEKARRQSASPKNLCMVSYSRLQHRRWIMNWLDDYWYAIKYEGNLVTIFRFETHAERDLFMSQQKDLNKDVQPLSRQDDIVELAYSVAEVRNQNWADGILVCSKEKLSR